MTYLSSKAYRPSRSEAQAFFADRQPFPYARASITFVAVANLAATVAMLIGQA